MSTSESFIGLINRMDDSFIRNNAYMVSRNLIARALKTVDPATQGKIFRNLMETEAEAIKKLMADLGTLSIEDVEAAQREILSMAQPYV
ncbi:hypothetical protein FACS1894109_07790 [Spirochaetia bacterium]|nr:hypothetical protein FACS1894109_07790 [Spirochaetia bacterium]